jgi:hypothetical protein
MKYLIVDCSIDIDDEKLFMTSILKSFPHCTELLIFTALRGKMGYYYAYELEMSEEDFLALSLSIGNLFIRVTDYRIVNKRNYPAF